MVGIFSLIRPVYGEPEWTSFGLAQLSPFKLALPLILRYLCTWHDT